MNIQFYLGISVIFFFLTLMMLEAYIERVLLGFDSKKQKIYYRIVTFIISTIFIIFFFISLYKLKHY